MKVAHSDINVGRSIPSNPSVARSDTNVDVATRRAYWAYW